MFYSISPIRRGAAWGCLMALIGSIVFLASVFLGLIVLVGLSGMGNVANTSAPFMPLYTIGFLTVAIGLLTVMPASILGAMGGAALGFLIHLNKSIGSSTLVCASAGGIVGLATTSLLVAVFLSELGGSGGPDLDLLLLGLYAMLIGAIAGSIAGWKLVRRT